MNCGSSPTKRSSIKHVAEISIIGAGPAGLIAAQTLAQAGHRVTIFDQMASVGRKFLLAGRGGLNLTHSEPLPDFLPRYGASQSFLAKALDIFSPDDLRAWCTSLGQDWFIGSSGRVFPTVMKTSPLLRAWLARLAALHVTIRPRMRWMGWNEQGALLFQNATHELEHVNPDATILALGGASWPRLGSDGTWVDLLLGRDIDVAPLKPANCGFIVPWSPIFRGNFIGHALHHITASFAGQIAEGEAIISDYGIEGGVIYGIGSGLRDHIEQHGEATMHIDLRPEMSHNETMRRLRAIRARESTGNTLRKALSLSPVAISLLRESTMDIPRDSEKLAGFVKAVPLRLIGTQNIGRAISSAGGIKWSALDEQLMLRRHPGLFVAGEMIDWEAPTGGYLLQACFSTGTQAARGVMNWLAARQP